MKNKKFSYKSRKGHFNHTFYSIVPILMILLNSWFKIENFPVWELFMRAKFSESRFWSWFRELEFSDKLFSKFSEIGLSDKLLSKYSLL